MKEDGTMARLPDLVEFARDHGLKIGTISDLIAYRHKHDNLLRERDDRTVTSAYGGDWRMRIFSDEITGTDHVVLSKGDITTPEPVLVRTHAINALEDILGLGPSPAEELPRAMQMIAEEGRGAVILFRDPYPRLRLDAEDEEGPRTVKNTGLGAQILSSLGLSQLVLLTDNPQTRYLGLDAYHIEIVGTRPIMGD
jgi:3,4-dihydroxy 2-butanone 4-phosphate synthase/GTP cyclohydrolase II